MRSTAGCSGSPTRCSCSRRGTSRSPPRSGRASSRRASSTSPSGDRAAYAHPMRIGLIGAGNMASALARGLGEPALVADVDGARAEALAREIGGEVAQSNAAAAAGSDAVFLCHKPAQLAAVADEIRDDARTVVSILGGTPVAAVEEAYPDRPVYRLMPSIPVEIRQGVVCYVPGARAAEGPEQELRELLARLGTVLEVPESLVDAATAVMSC